MSAKREQKLMRRRWSHSFEVGRFSNCIGSRDPGLEAGVIDANT